MNGIDYNTTLVVTIEARGGGAMAELVRGQETALLDRINPLLRERSVVLDMRHVERIDAAGIAALITLYCTARRANREFGIAHATSRVEEILALVGVSHLLTPGAEETPAGCGVALELAEA